MQCKDIPDLPILRFLVQHHPQWCTWYPPIPDGMPSVRTAMPPGVNDKLVHAKMRQLIRRKLVSGCNCGCRGDYEITAKGRRVVDSTILLGGN